MNFVINSSLWFEVVTSCIRNGSQYGSIDVGKGESAIVEYVSANPTGPLHVGHMRGAIIGDVVANLLQFVGYRVTREYYVNDGGSQIVSLAKSVVFAISWRPMEKKFIWMKIYIPVNT